MDLTKDQALLLLSTSPDDVSAPLAHPAPEWLVAECEELGLVERISGTSAWRLTAAGAAARAALLVD